MSAFREALRAKFGIDFAVVLTRKWGPQLFDIDVWVRSL